MSDILRYLQEAVGAFWNTLLEMSPYLLFGFLAAGLLSILILPRHVERHLGGHGLWPVLKAALFGIPLPLCSCSVIPVTASLRKHGAGRGAASAFLIATPQTGVDSIFVTFSLLGPIFAVFRPVAALLSGVIGGIAADVLEPHGAKDTQSIEKCEDACCNGDRRGSRLCGAIRYAFVELPRDIARPLLIGVAVAGVIAALVPDGYFVNVGSGVGAILVMMLLGIPVYVCATASIPVAAALMMKGVSPGAALAFLMTGPATNAAGIATVWKIMGARTAVVYLFSVAVTAFGSGLVLDLFWKAPILEHQDAAHEMLPMSVKVASAVLLLAVLGCAMVRGRAGGAGHDHSAHEPGHDAVEPACPHCSPNQHV